MRVCDLMSVFQVGNLRGAGGAPLDQLATGGVVTVGCTKTRGSAPMGRSYFVSFSFIGERSVVRVRPRGLLLSKKG